MCQGRQADIAAVEMWRPWSVLALRIETLGLRRGKLGSGRKLLLVERLTAPVKDSALGVLLKMGSKDYIPCVRQGGSARCVDLNCRVDDEMGYFWMF